MIKVIQIKGGTDNCYLVTDGRQAILVDTASKQNLDQVIAVCDQYDMKLIVLTHVHFDHAENAAELSRRYGIPVAAHKKYGTGDGRRRDSGRSARCMDHAHVHRHDIPVIPDYEANRHILKEVIK